MMMNSNNANEEENHGSESSELILLSVLVLDSLSAGEYMHVIKIDTKFNLCASS